MPVGRLIGAEDNSVSFAYADHYLEAPEAVPISLSLPLIDQPFDDNASRAYFANLLPENDQMLRIMDREGVNRDDVVGLLYHLGADCVGALSCLPYGSPPTKVPGFLGSDYDFLDPAEIAEIVRRLADREPLPDEIQDPSPLGGVQRKIALVATPDHRFALPKPGVGAPTTHILKAPRRGEGRDAYFEAAAAELARACGLNVAVPDVVEFGGVPAILIARFDRKFGQDGLITRIHHEDFAQALSLPPSLKYERYGRPGRAFDLASIFSVLDRCAEPALAKEAFILTTFFNLAIGNSDNHAKNHALLYDRGKAPRLAPLYDLLPIRISAKYTHRFAFNIGAAAIAEDLTRDSFADFFQAAGMTKAGARRFVDNSVASLLRNLDAAASLSLPRLKDFADLIGMESRRLTEILGIKIELTERDYFTPQAPGWASS